MRDWDWWVWQAEGVISGFKSIWGGGVFISGKGEP